MESVRAWRTVCIQSVSQMKLPSPKLPDGGSFCFGPESRLKKKADFFSVQQQGAKVYSKHFVILVAKSELQKSRLGVTVTKKVAPNAVVRNRIKRRLREIFRLNRTRFSANFDILVIARHNAEECSYHDIKREVMGALFHGKFLC